MGVDISKVNWIKDRPINESYEAIKASYVNTVDKFLINMAKVCKKGDVISLGGQNLYNVFTKWCENNKAWKWDNSKTEFTPHITLTAFFLKIKNMITVSQECGVLKKKVSCVVYNFDIDKMTKHYEKRKLLDLDYYFSDYDFMGRYLICDED